MKNSFSTKVLQLGSISALLTASTVARADSPCSDPIIKDLFVQGGEQVLDEINLKMTSLGQEEEIERSATSFTCKYLVEMSDHTKRWVRFTYSLDEAGQPAIDYEEEEKSTRR